MVPAMLEIGHTLIEALDLYEVHQQFMEKIEVRNSKKIYFWASTMKFLKHLILYFL